MLNRKFMLIAIFLVGLLAMSAVSATDLNGTDEIASDDGFDDSLGIVQDDSFLTNDSSDGDSLLQGSEEHDSSIGLADEKDILESSSDDSFLTNNPNDGDSFDDYIVWYDKDVNGFANITCTENPDNITIKLSVDGSYLLANAYLTLMDDLGDNFENSNNISIVGTSPLFADFDLAIINNYDYKITKLTMDSNGIAVFEIPFVVKEFSFCVGGWYDEGHICDYANITQTFEFDVDGTSMVYNLSAMTLVFNGGTWHNSNWQNGPVDNNSSGGNNSNWQNGTVDNNSSVGDNGTIDNGTFTALQNKINCASEGSTLYLENDYFYDDGFSFREMDIMSIEKSLIIDGNGHSIDALGKSGIFYIFGDITLKNIRFCNANSNGSHGAICGSGYDVVNCTFVNNSAKYGSAINDANQVVNCTFIGNSASEVDTGDVIYDADYVVNCSFVNNSADVIYIADYVVNCSFVNNSARAIISTNHVVNCSFVNNSAFEGGAISNANYILNCSFVNNSAFEGGAIYSDYNFSVVNCSFVNNSAWNGGAIWGSVYNVVNCSFVNNSAWNYLDEEGYYVVAYGGAMYRGSAVNCNFSGNYVTEYGGAIYSGSAVNCTFIGNFASDDGGAIYGGSAKGCSFVNNSAGEHGGAIHSSSAVNCNFTNNSAYWSDAISFYSLDSYDTSVEIEEGTVIDFNNPYGSSVKEIKIDNCNIQDDSLNNYGCIEVVGKRLILASTGNNDKVMVIISGEEYLPYSCEQMSKEKGEYTVVYEVLLFNLTDLSDGWYEVHLYYLGDPLHNILEITVPIYLQQTILIPSDDNNSSVGNVTDNNTNTSTGNTTNSNTTNTTGGNASNTKPTPEIVVPPLDKPSNDGTVSLTLPNDATGTITLTINNNDYYFAVVNGVAKVVIPNLGNGNYPYTITYSGDSKYASFTTNASLTVNNIIPTTITPAASKVTTVYGGKYTVATLKDGSGKVIAGVKVTVKFSNGKTATATTDKYGKIKVTITGLVPLKTYKATITYAGNTKYAKSTKAVNVYVKKATPKITAKAKTFKKSTKTKKYAVKLNVNQKVKVAIKVNKKIYYAYTNTKGQTTFKITKLTKKGKYTATVSSVANNCYNKAKSVKVKINVK